MIEKNHFGHFLVTFFYTQMLNSGKNVPMNTLNGILNPVQ